MRRVTVLTAVVAGAVIGLAGPAQAAGLDPQTRRNALTAMEGEAYAHASYLAYAQEAERTDQEGIASLFRATAETERYDHFAAEAELTNFVHGNQANLRDSIAGEEHEATVVYPSYAEQARLDDCPEAADLFTELAGDEAKHAARFRVALEALLNPGAGVVVPVGEVVPPVPIVRSTPACSGRTQDNLETTLRGEAFANAKYTLYAEHARATGQRRLARLWDNTAGQELGEHFAQTAILAGLVGSNADNLRTAIAGEEYEATTMYPSFSRQAAAAGDDRAAALFAEIAHDEADHASAFLRALVDLSLGGSGGEEARKGGRQPTSPRA
ncbi:MULTISPECIES: ferritin family protein [Micromonospora]|uniref:ferritin family protein n=1 Tax=Micromonospora TaxID=1873 RepID=UPI0009E27F22|nr:ferritin family protein [Micromonospora haikouensis]